MIAPIRRGPRVTLAASVVAILSGLASNVSPAAELPVPCVAGSCGASIPGFVQSGQAGVSVVGDQMRVAQTSDRAILNWSSFNVGAGGRVEFQQPNAQSIALNRIFQDSPSRVFGAIEANGQVYLVNQNGFVFGAGSRVRTAGLLASSLDLTDATFNSGLISSQLLQNGQAALQSDGRVGILDGNGRPVLGPDGKPLEVKLLVEQGAQISTNVAGGRILLASRSVENAGRLDAPDGQVVLAAGEKVYVAASTDPLLRGLLVEVDSGGKAWNKLTGEISAARGNVTVAGLAVNQDGRVSATTSIASNGSIRLLGRDTVVVSGGQRLLAQRGGTVTLGGSSETAIRPELADAATAVDEQRQAPSRIEIEGRQVVARSGSRVLATGGEIAVSARRNPSNDRPEDPESRVRIETGAVLDVAGSTAQASLARNLVTVELRANELRDSPLQRDGALRGQAVVVDARVGTPLADVSGAIAGIQRGIAERTSRGGSISIVSQGDVVVAEGATLDVSGGRIDYAGAIMQTSQLVAADGRVFDVGKADPNLVYRGLINPTVTRRFNRWGVVETSSGPAIGQFEAGYTEGQAAGRLQFAAPTLVLNGRFAGGTTFGPNQRDAASAALRGEFVIGVPGALDPSTNDYRAPSVTFVRTASPVSVGSDAPLPGPRTLELPVDFLERGGFGRTRIFSNGIVTLPMGTPLRLVEGSLLEVLARRIELDTSVAAPGGTVTLTSSRTSGNAAASVQQSLSGVFVRDGASIDVSGLWTNDTAPLIGPVRPDAGVIRLAANAFDDRPAELSIGNGVRLVANGGAWLQPTGSLVAGNAGRISLLAPLAGTSFATGDGIVLEANAVLGARAGAFVLDAGRIDIVRDSVWARSQRFDPTATSGTDTTTGSGGTSAPAPAPAPGATPGPGASTALRIGDALFSQGGFGSFELVATGPGRSATNLDTLVVRSGTSIDLRPQYRELRGDASAQPSGSRITDLGALVQPIEVLQRAGSLALRADPLAVTDTGRIGSLRVEANTVMRGPAGSAFTFGSTGNLSLAGQVYAPSGEITARLFNPSFELDSGFRAGQALEVAAGAVLDVSGVVLVRPSDTGLQRGEVLPGGSIGLLADRGSVNVRGTARLDVSGTQGALDLPSAGQSSGYRRETVASAAGSVSLRAPESLLLEGTLRARAGVGTSGTAPAGSLSVQLTRNRGFDTSVPLLPTFPSAPRVVRIGDTPFGAGAGGLPSGLALLNASSLAASGIDSLTVEAGNTIKFDQSLALTMARRLVLDAPVIDIGSAGSVRLGAPYVSIGSTFALQSRPAPAIAGSGQLSVAADLVDVGGFVTVDGAADVSILSTGDLRFRGVNTGVALFGALTLDGSLALGGSRLFPTTLSAFAVNVLGAGKRLSIAGNGRGSDVPFSVGGSLRLSADRIEQGGALWAPFGSIALNGRSATNLLDGSLTSVSANGAVLPWGRVALGSDWTYSLGRSPALQASIPDRQIQISGDAVSILPTATVDVRGGGDLYAYEWTPGTGGSVDALAVGTRPGTYAILPAAGKVFAPFDPQEFLDSDLSPGDSVYLSEAFGGLAAGTYALLPARYALLPGAYLVRGVGGFADLQPGQGSRLQDGSQVVAGYRTFAGTGLRDTRTSGFALQPGAVGRTLASYTDFFASTFFPAAATRNDAPRPNVPADAGYLRISAARALNAQGRVLGAAASGGLGSLVDVAGPSIIVSRSVGQPVVDATLRIDPDVLQSWRPGSLLLGGLRDRGAATLTPVATSVSFRDDGDLDLPEALVVARSLIELAPGAIVASSASALPVSTATDRRYALLGDAADRAPLLAVSNVRALQFDRPLLAAPGAADGAIRLQAGSRLAASGSLVVDAPGGAALDGSIAGAGADWVLAGRRVAVTDANLAGTVSILPSIVPALQQAGSLLISGSTSIDFLRSVQLPGLGTLTLAAGALRAGPGTASVDLGAREVTLRGLGSGTATTLGGNATLGVTADSLRVQAGNLVLDGFSASRLQASGSLSFLGGSTLRSAGDITLAAAAITTATGVDASVEAAGNLVVDALGATAPSLSGTRLGGALTLSGRRLDFGGRVLMPSGLLTLRSVEDLAIRDSAVLDLSGALVRGVSFAAAAPGGRILVDSGARLTAGAGARLLVDGAGSGDAGRIGLRAAGPVDFRASMSGLGKDGGEGGRLTLDAGSLASFATFASLVEAGQFRGGIDLRLRAGDLNLAAGQSLTARNVSLAADDGSIRIDGAIVAPSSDAGRGVIGLFAARDLRLGSSGRLEASGTVAGSRGGSVTLSSAGGSVALLPGSAIDTSGVDDPGRVLVRAPARGFDIAVEQLAARLSGVESLTLEPVLPVTAASAQVGAADFDGYRNTAANFMNVAEPAIRARLALGGTTPLVVQPGVEVRRSGDLRLGSAEDPLDVDLADWRFGGDPVALTFRATGSIATSGTISDGFGRPEEFLDVLAGRSATLRFAAGAALASANFMATTGSTADLRLEGAILRTGTGNLELAAARDVVFAGARASVYTAGEPTIPSLGDFFRPTFTHPSGGGAVRIRSGRDIVGNSSAQPVGAWQPREGSPDPDFLATRWGSDPDTFGWNVGTLGGGDISLSSGRDLLNLSVAAADSAIQTGPATLDLVRGGAVTVDSGRDIGGSLFHVTAGRNRLDAGGAFSRTRFASDGRTLLGSTFSMQNDARIALGARRDIFLEPFSTPTILVQADLPSELRANFYTLTGESGARATSIAGNLTIRGSTQLLSTFLGRDTVSQNSAGSFGILPANLRLFALSGDIRMDGTPVMFPSDRGQLEIFAGRDVANDPSLSFLLSDAAASGLAGPLNPRSGGFGDIRRRAESGRHEADTVTAVVSAVRNVVGGLINSAKSILVEAGRDVLNVRLFAQNARPDGRTRVLAARDVRFTRDQTVSRMEVGGPGRFEVVAGRNVDLGFSQGISTLGRLGNPALKFPDGADVFVLAGTTTIPSPAALTDFFRELVAAGREANQDPATNFARGYAAIDALFPGSRPTGTATSPYVGSISLPFSRIYTLGGGGITLVAPGGILDVGVATPPVGAPVRKPSELGIVAQRAGDVRVFTSGNVLVNASRVFTLSGGNIAIWSTTGDIDAGRGAKSAISAPAPTVEVDSSGNFTLNLSGAAAGSGIRAILTDPSVKPGDVDLIAPSGIVNAGDAGIGSAGNLNVAAQQVVGLDNIQVGGSSTGVPAETSSLGASLSGASSVGNAAGSSATSAATSTRADDRGEAPLAKSALGWLDVFVEGFGDEVCKPNDAECLQRNRKNP